MTNEQIIDKYIEEFCGKIRNHEDLYICDGNIYLWYPGGGFDKLHLCTTEQFQQRARELGWINGYRYGVEYPTNGKKPDLPDDVLVEFKSERLIGWNKSSVDIVAWGFVTAFRIVDRSFKPVEQKPKHAELTGAGVTVQMMPDLKPTKDISDAIVALSDAIDVMLDAGLMQQAKQVQSISKQLSELAATRAKELERDRVVEKVFKSLTTDNSDLAYKICQDIYDKGFLKLP